MRPHKPGVMYNVRSLCGQQDSAWPRQPDQGYTVNEKVEVQTQAALVLSQNSSSLLLKEVILHGLNAFAGWELGLGGNRWAPL